MDNILEKIAQLLNNSEYPFEVSEEIKGICVNNGIVIVSGYSDDGTSFNGAFDDEAGYGEILIDEEGPLPSRDDIDEDDELEKYFNRKNNAKTINALWCEGEGYCWTYETTIPHKSFDIIEDGEDSKFCRGIVFMISDLKQA